MVRIGLAVLVSLASVACGTGGHRLGGSGGSGGGGADGCPPGERELSDGRCLPAGEQADGCAAGEIADEGACRPAGLGPADCAEGFAHDGDVGCEPILPAEACGPGLWAIPGDSACRDFTSCGAGPWPDVMTPGASLVHVDASATAPADGSAGAPFAAIQPAVDAAPDGAFIVIAQGSYDGPVAVSDKRVTLWGRCGSLVTLWAQGGSALTFGPGSEGSEARGLAITGDGHAITVNDAAGIVLTDMWIHDLSGHGVHAERQTAPTDVTVRSSLIDHVTGRGIYAVGAAITADSVAIRDMQENALLMGRAVDTDLQPDTLEPNVVTLERVHIERASDIGVMVHASTGTMHASLVEHTLARSDGRSGRGANVQTDTADRPGRLTITGSVIDGAFDGGAVAANAELTLDRVVVRNVEVNQQDLFRGYGVAAVGLAVAPTRVVVRRSLVEAAHEAGIVNIGGDLDMESVVVRDTQPIYDAIHPDLPRAFGGRGVVTQPEHLLGLPATTVIRGSVIRDNVEAGVAVFGAGLTLEGSRVEGQLPIEGRFGRGVVVQYYPLALMPAQATLRDTVISANHEAGISVTGSEVTVEGVLMEDNLPSLLSNAGVGMLVELEVETLAPASAQIRDSILRRNVTAALIVGGAEVTIAHSLVASTLPAPSDTATFGDGLAALWLFAPAHLVALDNLVIDTERAGAAAFGATMDLGGNVFECAAIDLAADAYEGIDATVNDLGDNHCGCGQQVRPCKALSASLTPPEPPPPL